MYYVGIDWADQKYDLVILDDAGKQVYQPLEIKKSDQGFNTLLAKLRTLSPCPDDFKIGIETPHNLLVDFLLLHHYPVFFIHPSSMKSFRKRYRRTNARDDVYDSYVLADVARTDRACWKKVDRGSELTNQIRMLVVDHHRLIQKKTAVHNVFQETLKQYYPEYIHFFKDVSCPTSLAFFQAYPTFDAAATLSQQQLINFFKEQHLYNTKTARRIYDKLHQAHLDVIASVVQIKRIKAMIYANQLVEFNHSVDDYLTQINQALARHADAEIFSSFPGVAEVTTARLIALFGDNRAIYDDVSVIQAMAGTCPVTEKTGYDKKKKKGHYIVYFRQGCNKVYRDFVHRMAFASLTKSKWMKVYYDQHRKSGHTHHHALRCLANLELKILFAMWKNHNKYDENIFLAQRTKHQLNQK